MVLDSEAVECPETDHLLGRSRDAGKAMSSLSDRSTQPIRPVDIGALSLSQDSLKLAETQVFLGLSNIGILSHCNYWPCLTMKLNDAFV